MKVVLDTNILISGILSDKGAPALVLDAWRNGGYELLVSPAILHELRRVLSYAHIRQLNRISEPEIDQFIQSLEEYATVVDGSVDVTGAVPDDPDDEMFLACAIEGGALIIISGDRHLLDLKEYAHISIISARQFWDRFGIGQ